MRPYASVILNGEPFTFSFPGWMLFQDLFMDGTIRRMCARQVTSAHKEFIDDLAAGEFEGLLENLHPFFLCLRMMLIEPVAEGTVTALDDDDALRVMDGGFHFEAVADDAGILQQLCFFLIGVTGNLFQIEPVIGFEEIVLLFQNGLPAEPGLVDLKDQSCEQQVIIIYWKTIFGIMINAVHILFIESLDEGAIGSGHF